MQRENLKVLLWRKRGQAGGRRGAEVWAGSWKPSGRRGQAGHSRRNGEWRAL